MTYTIETLKEINQAYHSEHRVKQSDVDLANNWVEFIESTRDDKAPQVGDVVELTNKYGDFYKNAHIDDLNWLKTGKLYVCEQPYIPFVSAYSGKLATSTSGGAWCSIPDNLRLIGKRKKYFKDWGHCGACGNGAFHFVATVNVWECIEPGNIYGGFTTKNYDCFHASIVEDEKKRIEHHHGYKYLISSGAFSRIAFRSDQEYQAWLKTFNGVEFDGFNSNNKVVWTYKHTEKCIPLEKYNKVEYDYKDSTLCNAAIQECKRKIEGTTIITFLPYQNDKIKLENVKTEYMHAIK